MTDAELLFLCGIHDLPLVSLSLEEVQAAREARKRQGLLDLAVYAALLPLPESDGVAKVRRIAEDRQAGLDKALEALVRRAKRLGVAPPKYRVVRVEDVPLVCTLPLSGGQLGWCRLAEVDRMLWIEAETKEVRLDGWTFCATIEHLGEDGNLLRVAPSFKGTLPQAYRSDLPTCDHCHTRRKRAETFVLQHEDGRMVRIGRSCIRDFLGDRSADGCVAMAEMEVALLSAIEDAEGHGGGYLRGQATRVGPSEYLGVVALVIARIGWLSRGAARQLGRMGTADVAWRVLCPPIGSKPVTDAKGEVLSLGDVTEAMRQDGAEALAWARSLPADVDSDYLYNLRLISGLGSWSGRESGLGAAVLMSYQKEQDRLNRLRLERALPSVHLGSVGDRFGAKGTKKKPGLPPVRATVLSATTKEGDFGLVTTVRMQARAALDGHVHDLIWFASGAPKLVVNAQALQAHAEADARLSAARETFYVAERVSADVRWAWQEGKNDWQGLQWAAAPESAVEEAKLAPLREALAQALSEATAARVAAEEAERPLKAGDVVDLVATVSGHSVYGDSKRASTKLSRCVLMAVPVAPTVEPA